MPCSASPASTSTSRSRSASSSTTASSVSASTASSVACTLDSSAARWRVIGWSPPSSRIRSAAGRSCLARSRWIEACSALNPSNPSLAASRTTVAAPADGRLGEVGDGAEADELRALQHDLRRRAARPSSAAARRPGPAPRPPSPTRRETVVEGLRAVPGPRWHVPFRTDRGRAAGRDAGPWTSPRRRPARSPATTSPGPIRRWSRRSPGPTSATPPPTATIRGRGSASGRFRELFGADVTTLLTFNGTGANVLALAVAARAGRRRRVHGLGAHRGRRDRRARAHPRRQADRPRRARRQADAGPARRRRPTSSAARTTPSRRSCRSPRAPSSARVYTVDEIAAVVRRRPPARDDRAHGRRPHRQRHRRARR